MGQVLGRTEGSTEPETHSLPADIPQCILIMTVCLHFHRDQASLRTNNVCMPRAFRQLLGGSVSAWASYTASQFYAGNSPLLLKTRSSQVTEINKDSVFKDLKSKACCQLNRMVKTKGQTHYRLLSGNDAYGVS